MKFYECTFIVRQDLPAQDVHKLVDRYENLVEKVGGKIIKREYWGLRSLAYEVKKNKKGHYVYLGISSLSGVVEKIENDFKVSEDVIKFLTIRVQDIKDRPTLMMQTPSETKK